MNLQHSLFLAIILQVNSVRSDKFSDFVTQKLQNYSTWLKENNLDPTELATGPTQFSIHEGLIGLACDLSIRNYGVRGHTNDFQINQISTNTSALQFITTFTLRNNISAFGRIYVPLNGEHSANGTFLSGTSINGNGTFYVTGSSLDYEHEMVFQVLPTGYLGFRRDRVARSPFENEDLFFQNLSDNEALVGYEDFLKGALSSGFRRVWMMDRADPLPSYFSKYWMGILSETTLEDIIGNSSSSYSASYYSY